MARRLGADGGGLERGPRAPAPAPALAGRAGAPGRGIRVRRRRARGQRLGRPRLLGRARCARPAPGRARGHRRRSRRVPRRLAAATAATLPPWLGISAGQSDPAVRRLARLIAVAEQRRQQELSPEKLRAAIAARPLDWTYVDAVRLVLPTEAMAAEAALRVREDGETLDEVGRDVGAPVEKVERIPGERRGRPAGPAGLRLGGRAPGADARARRPRPAPGRHPPCPRRERSRGPVPMPSATSGTRRPRVRSRRSSGSCPNPGA